MSRLEALAEEVLTSGRLPAATFDRGRPDPIAYWRGDDAAFVSFLLRRSDGAFDVLTTGALRGSDGEWEAGGATMGSGVSYEFPARPASGIDVFAMHGSGGHIGFPGFAAPGVREVLIDGAGSFPVFEPRGGFLAAVPTPAPGTELTLSAGGGEPFVYTMPRI
jgi:hypothetical protein